MKTLRIKLLKAWKPADSDTEYAAGTILDIEKSVALDLIGDDIAEKTTGSPDVNPAVPALTEAQVQEIVKTAVAAAIKPTVTVTATTDATGKSPAFAVVGRQHERVEDDPKLGFKSAGEFFQTVHSCNPQGNNWQESAKKLAPCGKAPSGMNAGIGSAGGFLLPPDFAQVIWGGLNVDARNLLEMTDNYTVEGESLAFTANAETSRATGSRWGGARAYWIAEAAQLTASNPKFRQAKIEPQELGVYIPVTDKLLNNATVALEQYLTRCATDEIRCVTGDSIINGTGAGQPLGILNAGCLVSISKESGQASATILSENIIKMWARLHPNSEANAVWLVNKDCGPALHTMGLATGGSTGQLTYMPPGALASSPNATLMGRPVIPCEYCPTLGSAGDIILADMRAYLSGTRGTINTAMSIHIRFDYVETVFRFTFAVDGQPWLASALTPFKGSNTQSTFVALAAR